MSRLPPSPARDAAIERLLPYVPEHGWTWRALPAEERWDGGLARELFPSGPAAMVEAFCDLADRRMLEATAGLDPALRPTQRLRAAVALRLAQNRPHRAAVRRAAAVMALPGYGGLAARCTWRTVDALWAAALDRSVDLSWYTKRASLALVYSATLLFWLRDDSADDAPTMAFFDRRVAGLRTLGRWRARLTGRT
jgi:ubiquinone biosynthesis protein COQ9